MSREPDTPDPQSTETTEAETATTEAISTEAIQEEGGATPTTAPEGERGGRGRPGTERIATLRQRVGRLRIRRISLPMDRWLMVLGGAMMVAGVAAIVLGWYGAAHTPYDFEQVPYLISGGLLGLALATLGGLFYFAYWLTRQIAESRTQSDATAQALARIAELLAGGSNGSRVSAGNGGVKTGEFVATATGTMIHRPDCSVVVGRKGLRSVSPDDPGLEPCKLCDPLGSDEKASS
jgi:hypothetical protein